MGGMMGYPGPSLEPMTVTADQAKHRQSGSIETSRVRPPVPDEFYGYYTVHIRKDGRISGAVNGYGGEVWYHTWHGAFIASKEASG